MRLHTNKKAIRSLGVAESFRKGDRFSTLAGVVMRADLVIDGFAFGRATVEGDDATEAVAKVYAAMKRNDVSVIMLSGMVLSLYNVVDLDLLARSTGLPVICLTYKRSSGLEGAIRHHFGDGPEARSRIELYQRLAERKRLTLDTGIAVYFRSSGLGEGDTERLLNMFTIQGGVPEPVRVAKLLAHSSFGLERRRS